MTIEFVLKHFVIFGIYSGLRKVIPWSYDVVFEGIFSNIFVDPLGVWFFAVSPEFFFSFPC